MIGLIFSDSLVVVKSDIVGIAKLTQTAKLFP